MIPSNEIWRKIIDIQIRRISSLPSVCDEQQAEWIKVQEEDCTPDGPQSQNIANEQASGSENDASTDSCEVKPPSPDQKELQCFSGIKKCDTEDNACQELFWDGLTKVFTRQLTDDAIDTWTPQLHDSVKENCEKFLEIYLLEFHNDVVPLLDVLAMVFDEKNKFHTFNAMRKSEYLPPHHQDAMLYARSSASSKNPRGWLVDLINRFGSLGGFIILRSRFLSDCGYPTIPVILALLRPFELCKELLTDYTIFKYFVPIAEELPKILDGVMHDQALEEVADVEFIRDSISAIIKAMKSIVSRVAGQKNVLKKLESSRLAIMLCLLPNSQDVLELLVKEVGDMTCPEDLDHFLECFQANWTTAGKTTRRKLLKFVLRLIKEDKNDVLVAKVLELFWNLTHSDEISTATMEQTLNAHVKILDYSNTLGRDVRNIDWLDKCVEKLSKADNQTLPALKYIRKICNLYEANPNRQSVVYYRQEIIDRMQAQDRILALVANNLENYMENMRQLAQENPQMNETNFMPDGRYNHVTQVQERLNFLRFILKAGYLWLDAEDSIKIWRCLVEQRVFESDRKMGFQWFTELIDGDSDLYPELFSDFFHQIILKIAPESLDECGFKCFKKFFKVVNTQAGIVKEKYGITIRQDLDLMGSEYLWCIVTDCSKEIANRAIKLFKEVNGNVGPHLSGQTVQRDFAKECKNRVKNYHTLLQRLKKDCKMGLPGVRDQIVSESTKMSRVAKLLQEHNDVYAWGEIDN